MKLKFSSLYNYCQRLRVKFCAGFHSVSLSTVEQLNEDNILSANYKNPHWIWTRVTRCSANKNLQFGKKELSNPEKISFNLKTQLSSNCQKIASRNDLSRCKQNSINSHLELYDFKFLAYYEKPELSLHVRGK